MKEAESGIKLDELSRQYGFSKSAFYKWKAKYGGMDASALKIRLSKMWSKKIVTVSQRRDAVREAMTSHQMSKRHACRLFRISRSVYHYQAKPNSDDEIRAELVHLAIKYRSWRYDKMCRFLRNQGFSWNYKRVRRVYREMGLNLRVKPKKRLPSRERVPLVAPEKPNVSWSMDFMQDSLPDTDKF